MNTKSLFRSAALSLSILVTAIAGVATTTPTAFGCGGATWPTNCKQADPKPSTSAPVSERPAPSIGIAFGLLESLLGVLA